MLALVTSTLHDSKRGGAASRRLRIAPHSRDHEGNTPLHYACSLELPSMAQVLAKHKPRLDLVNRGGNTALLYACSNSMESAALLLIEKV